MMNGIEFLEDAIPEFIVIFFAVVTLGLCIYGAFKHRDLPAAGYVPPLVYIIGMYIYFWLANPPLLTREFFDRLGFIILLTDIGIWRVAEAIANKSKNGSGQRPVSFKDIKDTFTTMYKFARERIAGILKRDR